MTLGDLSEEEVEGIRTGAESDPTIGQLRALASVFGIEPSYLLDRGEPPLLDEELVKALRDEDVRDIVRELAATRWGEAASVGNRAAVRGPRDDAKRLELTKIKRKEARRGPLRQSLKPAPQLMGSITGETNGPSGEPIGPRQILRILQQAISGDARLKTTPREHIAKLLIADGRLPEETSPKLVCEVLGIMREGGMGLREPALQPCMIESFWDGEAGRVHDGIDLSMSVDWTGAPPMWEKREIPEKLTHDDSRACTGLLAEPDVVLMDKARWPLHLCEPQFTSQSTSLWALDQPFAADDLNNQRWAAMWPLPIGRQALMIRSEMADVSAWTSVFGVLPFEEHEQAMWALRIRYREKASVHTLDLFGLAEYPDEMHQRLAIPVAGKLAFVVRGHGRRPIDLLDAAESWWAQFRGLTLRGRPKGTGTWRDREHFLGAARAAVMEMHFSGGKVTQEAVAARLNTSDRMLRQWVADFNVTWQEIKNG